MNLFITKLLTTLNKRQEANLQEVVEGLELTYEEPKPSYVLGEMRKWKECKGMIEIVDLFNNEKFFYNFQIQKDSELAILSINFVKKV
jgi:hypothetical protein